MSWNVQYIGKPSAIAKALEEHSNNLDGQSKVEFDSALPHLVGLVKENFENEGQEPLVKLSASGYGSALGEKQISRNSVCQIERIYGILV